MSPPHDRRRMKGVGRVAFIAHLAEITAELDAGWPIKAVYENRKERLGMSYAQFTRYVDQIVRHGRRTQVAPPTNPASSQPSKARMTVGGSSEKAEGTLKLHLVLQGKGGVGKTVAALLLSQCIEEKGEPV